MSYTYHVGDTAIVECHFIDGDTRQPVYPDTLVIEVTPPTLPAYTLTMGVDAAVKKVRLGVITVDVDLLEDTDHGPYATHWIATGARAKGANRHNVYPVRP